MNISTNLLTSSVLNFTETHPKTWKSSIYSWIATTNLQCYKIYKVSQKRGVLNVLLKICEIKSNYQVKGSCQSDNIQDYLGRLNQAHNNRLCWSRLKYEKLEVEQQFYQKLTQCLYRLVIYIALGTKSSLQFWWYRIDDLRILEKTSSRTQLPVTKSSRYLFKTILAEMKNLELWKPIWDSLKLSNGSITKHNLGSRYLCLLIELSVSKIQNILKSDNFKRA